MRLQRMFTRTSAAALVAAMLLLTAGSPASADVPPGEPPTCDSGDQYSFLRLDPTKKFLTVIPSTSLVRADATGNGWQCDKRRQRDRGCGRQRMHAHATLR